MKAQPPAHARQVLGVRHVHDLGLDVPLARTVAPAARSPHARQLPQLAVRLGVRALVVADGREHAVDLPDDHLVARLHPLLLLAALEALAFGISLVAVDGHCCPAAIRFQAVRLERGELNLGQAARNLLLRLRWRLPVQIQRALLDLSHLLVEVRVLVAQQAVIVVNVLFCLL